MNLGQWLGIASLFASLYILWQVRHLLLLLFTAIILAVALNRFVRWLKIQRNLGIVVTLGLLTIAVTLFFVLIVPPFIEQFQRLLELLPRVWQQIRLMVIALKEHSVNFNWLPPPPQSLAEALTSLQPLWQNGALWKNFLSIFSDSLAALLQLLFIMIIAVILLLNPLPYRQGFLKLFPSFYRYRADVILQKTEEAIGNWLTGIIINCVFIGLLSGVGLWILGIKLVLVHALMAGLLNFIPNIGPALSVVFPVMIAILDSPWKVWAILALYFVIQNVESYWLTPIVMAQQVSLLPAVTLLAQIFFAQTFGVLGLLLALPLTVVAKTWLEEVLFKDILDVWGESSYETTAEVTELSDISESNTPN